MGALNQLVSRFAGGRRAGGRPTTGGMGTTGHAGPTGAGGGRAQDEAIGRGVRSVLGKLRKR